MGDFQIKPTKLGEIVNNGDIQALEHFGGVVGLAEKLHSDINIGLSSTDPLKKKRKEFYGVNFVPPKSSKSFLALMIEAAADSTLILLMVSAIVSLVLGVCFEDPSTGWIEGTAILVSVFIVVLVTSGNNYAKEKQFRILNAQVEDTLVSVIRDGTQQRISTYKLVVGDVIEFAVGDILQVDGVLLRGYDVRIDESSVTGESYLIKKDESKPFILSGTRVMEGGGKYMALAVGPYSQAGMLKALITESEDNKSVLQKKLEILAMQIGKAGTVVAAICVFTLYYRYISAYVRGEEKWELSDDAAKLLGYFITGITILVVAVPEGLPLAVTLSLAFSVQKMQKDNNLVKHLDACETMGSATTICSDKTGTLTTNRMTVTHSWLGDQLFGSKFDNRAFSETFNDAFLPSIAINSTARLERRDNDDIVYIGNTTECALLQFSYNFPPFDYTEARRNIPVEKIFTFSSARKRMSTIIRLSNGKHRLFVKGASEIVIDLCDDLLTLDGNKRKLQNADKQRINAEVINKFAEEGLRTICIAYRDIDANLSFESAESLENNLTCLGIVGIEDPVREAVPMAIQQCQEAGIFVRMVTGDNIVTAKSIAKQCGLLKDGDDYICMEGPEFRARVLNKDGSINQAEFDKIWPKLRVMARSSPTDKYTLVTGLKETLLPEKPVVAVTGDGTNDAPALNKADVGFAMGIAGTAVAKDACDIILLDDNFESIVKAVMWGRNVYDSIGKFLQFQLTVNVVAIIVAMTGAIVLEESPLTAVQMLWVNLIMDSLASLALATEPPTKDLLKRAPYHKNKSLISPIMWINILGHAIYQVAIVMFLIFYGETFFGIESGRNLPHDAPPSIHYTIVFNTFVLMQLFNEINSRKLHGEFYVFSGLFNNFIFVGIWIFTLLVQILLVQYGALYVHCVALTVEQWLWCILFGTFSLLWNFVVRVIQKIIISSD